MRGFEKELADRASEMGWDQCTQNITKFTNTDRVDIDLITQYGQIDEQTLRTACEEFMTGANRDKHVAQNNEQFWRCIYSTLTKEAKTTLLTYAPEYTMMIDGKPKEVGPLMYKTMNIFCFSSTTYSTHDSCSDANSRCQKFT